MTTATRHLAACDKYRRANRALDRAKARVRRGERGNLTRARVRLAAAIAELHTAAIAARRAA